ncbi:hypothetical protein M0811_00874 [Anaeramoeba ignava]|uniref:rRNA 2'-O-methyltransferase fibrillarin n=1 Tax=Anaeramoeba ignava TaxID=1746090 RepID=A0A9Q0LKN5_ANAIG|nr:hypothetical protein M0811_00874 [Anaeramoeba ignava]
MNRRQKPGRNSPTKSFGKGRGKPNQQGRKGKKYGHDGVYIVRGKEESLATVNLIPGETVYGEKKISQEKEGKKVEYRIWNPFRSKLAAAILGGIDKMWIQPGAKVLYLGAASGTTVSHCSDIVGETGRNYLLNAEQFLKTNGHYIISIKAKCIDSTLEPEVVFQNEVKKLRESHLKPLEQFTFIYLFI